MNIVENIICMLNREMFGQDKKVENVKNWIKKKKLKVEGIEVGKSHYKKLENKVNLIYLPTSGHNGHNE